MRRSLHEYAPGEVPSEEQMRNAREMARALGDDDNVARWSKLLWRHYLRDRYYGGGRERLKLLEGGK